MKLKSLSNKENIIFHIALLYYYRFIHRWMDKLGVAAKEGLGVIMRQTFYGGYYGLIDSNLMPNPVSLSCMVFKERGIISKENIT